MKNSSSSKTRRGGATRANILIAARERFAADGYERATIRAIAKDAGIDPSLVMRYYGNKAGLFAAAVEFDLHLPEMDATPRSEIGTAIVSHFLDRWEGDEILKALLRAAATNSDAAARMRSVSMQQTLPLVVRLCGDSKSAPVRNDLINSQLWGFAYSRYVLQLEPIVKMRRADIIKWLGPTVQRYVCGKKIVK